MRSTNDNCIIIVTNTLSCLQCTSLMCYSCVVINPETDLHDLIQLVDMHIVQSFIKVFPSLWRDGPYAWAQWELRHPAHLVNPAYMRPYDLCIRDAGSARAAGVAGGPRARVRHQGAAAEVCGGGQAGEAEHGRWVHRETQPPPQCQGMYSTDSHCPGHQTDRQTYSYTWRRKGFLLGFFSQSVEDIRFF